MSPASGARKPATRLNNVVLPHPDGPSSVISSPRCTCSETSCSATTSPTRLVMPSRRTASAGTADPGSAGLLNVEHLSEAEEHRGEGEQRRGRDDVDHRNRR